MGMGEPYLHPHFDAICREFKERYSDSFLISSTNAQFTATAKVAESLKYLDLLYISIDGFRDTYELYRPPAKWSKLIQFLEAIKDMPRHNCKIAINYTVNPGNVDDIKHVHGLLAEYNLDEIRINPVQNWDEEQDIQAISGTFSTEQLAHLRDNWSYAIKGKKEWDYKDCFWVQRGAYVTVEGHVKVCCLNTSTAPIKNIFFVKDINEVFETDVYQSIKSGCETNNPTSHCQNCSYKELVPLLQKLI